MVVNWGSLPHSFGGNLPSSYSSTIFCREEVDYLDVEKQCLKEHGYFQFVDTLSPFEKYICKVGKSYMNLRTV